MFVSAHAQGQLKIPLDTSGNNHITVYHHSRTIEMVSDYDESVNKICIGGISQ